MFPALVLRRALCAATLLSIAAVSAAPVALGQGKKEPSYYGPQPATETIDLNMYAQIRAEGLTHSHVMEYMSGLSDGIGPRLTGSPNMKKANEWTRDRLTDAGLVNAHLEDWGEFGMGWAQVNSWARMVTPDTEPIWIQAAPVVRGDERRGQRRRRSGGADDRCRPGQVQGQARRQDRPAGRAAPDGRPDRTAVHALYRRRTERDGRPRAAACRARRRTELSGAAGRAHPPGRPAEYGGEDDDGRRRCGGHPHAQLAMAARAAAAASSSTTMAPTSIRGAQTRANAVAIPYAVTTVEMYGRMYRLLKANVPVKMEVNIETTFTGDHEHGFNTVAEITGSDSKLKDQKL